MKDNIIKWTVFFAILFSVIWLSGVRVHPEYFKQYKAPNYLSRIIKYHPKENFFLKFSMNKSTPVDKNKSAFDQAMSSSFFYPRKKTSAPPPQKPVSSDSDQTGK